MKTTVRSFLTIFFAVPALFAQVPRTISFQGVLADAGGNLLPDGSHQLHLALYESAAGGWSAVVEADRFIQSECVVPWLSAVSCGTHRLKSCGLNHTV